MTTAPKKIVEVTQHHPPVRGYTAGLALEGGTAALAILRLDEVKGVARATLVLTVRFPDRDNVEANKALGEMLKEAKGYGARFPFYVSPAFHTRFDHLGNLRGFHVRKDPAIAADLDKLRKDGRLDAPEGLIPAEVTAIRFALPRPIQRTLPDGTPL